MNTVLERRLRQARGVLARREALLVVPGHVVDYALRAGHLVAVFPGVLVSPARAADLVTLSRAAVLCVGAGCALSHTSALAVWGLPAGDTGPVHVMTSPGRQVRVAGIVAHRRAGFVAEPPHVVRRHGLPVTRIEQSIVDSWPLASGTAQRAPLLRAVAGRLTTPARLRAALVESSPHLADRSALVAFVAKVAAGCHSELELWGYDEVFRDLPGLRRQVPVRLGGRTAYLDLLHEETRTNFELDGAAWHASPLQRERDLRRDAALATRGYQVVRFTHDRLRQDPAGVRREALAIISARRTS